MTQDALTAFFGWMTVLNYGLLALMGLSLLALQGWASNLHARMFGLDTAVVRAAYFRFLANYKILATVFSLVPWLALKLM